MAAVNPITPDQGDIPAHWSVTFATDDADATAAKAAELGFEAGHGGSLHPARRSSHAAVSTALRRSWLIGSIAAIPLIKAVT